MIRAALLAAVVAFPTLGLAHDHNHPEHDGWYGSLQKPGSNGYEGGGVPCCSLTDCHTTEAETRNGKWWARVGKPPEAGEHEWTLLDWVEVPAEAILNRHDNPTGEPVICHPLVRGPDGNVDPKHTPIFCFIPGIEA